MQEGYNWRKENNEDMIAYFVCHILNISGKSVSKNIEPKDLTKPIRKKVNKNFDVNEEKRLIEEEFAEILSKRKPSN